MNIENRVKFSILKKSHSLEVIKEKSDLFQNTKFYFILNIYNYSDGQIYKFAWVANSMLSCTVSYCGFEVGET